MYSFSERSLKNLQSCHHVLREMCHFAIKKYDFSVICGFRPKDEQDLAFKKGFSKLKWPNSAHNQKPSCAVDIIPYPVNWSNILLFHALNEVISDFRPPEGYSILWGGNWTTIKDYPHYELVIHDKIDDREFDLEKIKKLAFERKKYGH